MRYKNTPCNRDHLGYIVEGKRTSRIHRQSRATREEYVANAVKSTLKTYHNYVQSTVSLQKALGGVKSHQATRSTGSQSKADYSLETFQQACGRGQGHRTSH